mmetsp:Transcript_11110/g.21346  ORF Transcript_11110/g.21346 Transcript_11110/m.21346 type:complete len:241 (+) Transcript_11110:83-805(+)
MAGLMVTTSRWHHRCRRGRNPLAVAIGAFALLLGTWAACVAFAGMPHQGIRPSVRPSSQRWSEAEVAADAGTVDAAAEAALASPGFCFGHCLQKDGTWQLDKEGVPVQSEEEDVMASQVWELFSTQFPGAAKRGMYMDTPVCEQDVKYRWRKMRDNFGMTSEQMLHVIQQDAMPLVVDSQYVKGTWDAMVKGSSKEQAAEVLVKHPGILVSGPGIENNMAQAQFTSSIIGGMRDFGKMIR